MMRYSEWTDEEIAARGEEIYAQIRDTVEHQHIGKFLSIDVETGSYEIDAKESVTVNSILAKHPDAPIYGLRIGFPGTFRLGFRISAPTASNAEVFEIARRGEQIYRQFRDKVERQHGGKCLALDIESGDYEIATDETEASARLIAKRPDAVVYSLRIRFPGAIRLGFRGTYGVLVDEVLTDTKPTQ